MTMPFERTRALIFAYEYLTERRSNSNLPEQEKREIDVVLRHFPTPSEVRREANLQSHPHLNSVMGPWLGLSPETD